MATFAGAESQSQQSPATILQDRPLLDPLFPRLVLYTLSSFPAQPLDSRCRFDKRYQRRERDHDPEYDTAEHGARGHESCETCPPGTPGTPGTGYAGCPMHPESSWCPGYPVQIEKRLAVYSPACQKRIHGKENNGNDVAIFV